MVRSSFSILFFIRENKARKSDKAPIELMLTVNGERCSLPTGKQTPYPPTHPIPHISLLKQKDDYSTTFFFLPM